jgi:hypothetical protein
MAGLQESRVDDDGEVSGQLEGGLVWMWEARKLNSVDSRCQSEYARCVDEHV